MWSFQPPRHRNCICAVPRLYQAGPWAGQPAAGVHRVHALGREPPRSPRKGEHGDCILQMGMGTASPKWACIPLMGLHPSVRMAAADVVPHVAASLSVLSVPADRLQVATPEDPASARRGEPMVRTHGRRFASLSVPADRVQVATPEDPASARRGEPLYAFILRSIWGNLVDG